MNTPGKVREGLDGENLSPEFVKALESFKDIHANRSDLWQQALDTEHDRCNKWAHYMRFVNIYIRVVALDFVKLLAENKVSLSEVLINFESVLQKFSEFAPSTGRLPFIQFEGTRDPLIAIFSSEFPKALGKYAETQWTLKEDLPSVEEIAKQVVSEDEARIAASIAELEAKYGSANSAADGSGAVADATDRARREFEEVLKRR